MQLVAIKDDGSKELWAGSGSIISPEGLISTNAHVVDEYPDEDGEVRAELIEVRLVSRTDAPPEPRYLASLVAVDYPRDLAILRITHDIAGNPVTPAGLPVMRLGDDAAVHLNDQLTIIGFPGIGGDTVTVTPGTVGGFTPTPEYGPRSWIKTAATIAGGNSGGAALNATGELVGVPTLASAGHGGRITDCRSVHDTNNDGRIDNSDTCVPIGGFINGLRPVSMVRLLLDAVTAGQAYRVEFPARPTSQALNPGTGAIVFSSAISNDQPADAADSFPSGIPNLCAWFEYEGIPAGTIYHAAWVRDENFEAQHSVVQQVWGWRESGAFWACTASNPPDGLWSFVFMLGADPEVVVADAVVVGAATAANAASEATFRVTNLSSKRICYVYLSPIEDTHWGEDRLGASNVIDPNQYFDVFVPVGDYDLKLEDCSHERLFVDGPYTVNSDGLNFEFHDE